MNTPTDNTRYFVETCAFNHGKASTLVVWEPCLILGRVDGLAIFETLQGAVDFMNQECGLFQAHELRVVGLPEEAALLVQANPTTPYASAVYVGRAL